MPQLKHIVRFTTPVDISHLSKKKLSPAIEKALAVKAEKAWLLIRSVENVLTDSTQPLTVTEVIKAVENSTGRAYHDTHIRNILEKLEKGGFASSRLETAEERFLRAGGKARALHATYFFAPPGEVPERTVREAIPGVLLSDTAGRKRKITTTVTTVSESTSRLLAGSESSFVIEHLLSIVIDQKTQALQEELAATQRELAELRETLRSLL